jgi:hypothetical protein
MNAHVPLDPAESIAAAVGPIRLLLGDAVMTAAVRDQAASMARSLRRDVRAMFRGDTLPLPRTIEPSDWRRASNANVREQLSTMAGATPWPPVLAAGAMAVMEPIMRLAYKTAPGGRLTRLFSQEVLSPSAFASAGWADDMSLLDEPSTIVARVAVNNLSEAQAETFRSMWPSMYAYVSAIVATEAVTMRVGELPRATEDGLSTLLGVPTVNDDVTGAPSRPITLAGTANGKPANKTGSGDSAIAATKPPSAGTGAASAAGGK